MKKLRRFMTLYKILKIWDSCGPLPWYTYPAIEFLSQLNLFHKSVFEYGAGSSTQWWAARCQKLTTVEDDREWYHKLMITCKDFAKSFTARYRPHGVAYAASISETPEKYDIIVIDGSFRRQCAEEALKKIRPDGFIILDNSDWFPETAAFLRESGLLEVNMTGMGPGNSYAWTTSFYFKKGVSLERLYRSVVGGFPHTEREV